MARVGEWGRQTRTAVAARPGRVRAGVEIALVALLAVQGGRLAWIFVAPQPETTAAARVEVAPVDASIFQRFDAFFRTGDKSSLAEAAGADSDALRLFGVRAGGPDGGSAIIGLPDGRQVSVGVGETISDGLTLASVGEDYVTVSRGGSVSRLVFTETPAGAATPPPPPAAAQVMSPTSGAPAPVSAAASAAAPTGPVVDPQRLMAQASLRPRMDGLRIRGFTLAARGDGAALRAAGLQSGDVILAVNGAELNSLERLSELGGDLSGSSAAEIRFERNGRVQTTTIRTGQ
ncbi:general secretion pathway protein [Brevundimonas sp. MYb46]|nr:general secretion pathway protein [Brevundimonas sp. MYb31]PRA28220.1 general secretion pathway protein [Brevundimonas sp. MYb27]PRB15442.1 general secretion pathway protein [Brevundimonas sp. MYb52]PRB35772.1 general secretion pathway protein [Brevundimonas sp. MYb46]PRB46374.1 general secretion pathway protein [Brevundimonas sp. MYb33]